MKYLGILMCAVLSFALFSCGSESVSPDENENTVAYNDYIWFDTGYHMAKYQGQAEVIYPEPVLDWEKSLGEPFIDNNGNGIFDNGIDEFTMCDCAQNMDLDHNGRYTGPDDAWEPGIPFDDINGNGEFDYKNYNYSWDYSPGEPFADYNDNGVWDENPEFAYTVIGLVQYENDLGDKLTTIGRHIIDSLYFISDSGITYEIPFVNNGFSGKQSFTFTQRDSGLYFSYLGDTNLVAGREFFVIDTGDIEPGIEYHRLVKSTDYYILYYDRTVETGVELNVDGKTYTDLLHIIFNNPDASTPEGYYTEVFEGTFYEFYFSRTKGMIGFLTRPVYNYSIRTQFYDVKLPSKNIEMVK